MLNITAHKTASCPDGLADFDVSVRENGIIRWRGQMKNQADGDFMALTLNIAKELEWEKDKQAQITAYDARHNKK